MNLQVQRASALQESTSLSTGKYTYTINNENLVAGIYILKVNIYGTVLLRKIEKMI